MAWAPMTAVAQHLSIDALKDEVRNARAAFPNVHVTYGSTPNEDNERRDNRNVAEDWQVGGAHKHFNSRMAGGHYYFESADQKAELWQRTKQGTIFGNYVPHPYVPLLAGYSFDGQPFEKWLDRAGNVSANTSGNEVIVKAELKGFQFTFTLDRRYGSQITNLKVEKDTILYQEDEVLAFRDYKGGFIPAHIVRHIQSTDISRMPMGAMEFHLHEVGPATRKDVTVTWPEGAIVKDVPANKLFRVVDGKLKLDHVLISDTNTPRTFVALGIVWVTALTLFVTGRHLTKRWRSKDLDRLDL